ncbi:MAG: ATP-binding protein [bacterium]
MPDEKKRSLVELKVPCRPEFLRVVRLLVSGYATRWEMPFDEIEYLKVAVSEACNNAIQCAGEGKDEAVRIRCWREKGRLGFEVGYTGKSPERPGGRTKKGAPPEDETQLSLILIRMLMEDVRISSTASKGTRIVMYKSLKAAGSARNVIEKKPGLN